MQRYPVPPEPPQVVFTADRNDRDLAGRGDLIRVGRGAYMVRAPAGTPLWRLREMVTLARCEAALRAYPSALALTHEAAAVVQGLSPIEQEPGIRVAVETNRSRTTRPLPSVTYGRPGSAPAARPVSVTRSLVAPRGGRSSS